MIEYGQTDNKSEERQDMNISFEYPYGGLIFYTDEEKAITVKINGVNGDFKLICSLFNYNGKKIFESKDCIKPVDSKATYRLTLPIKYKGYYKFTVRAESGECFAEKSTGIGLTVPHERSGDNSVFGISCNFWNPATDPALYERVEYAISEIQERKQRSRLPPSLKNTVCIRRFSCRAAICFLRNAGLTVREIPRIIIKSSTGIYQD